MHLIVSVIFIFYHALDLILKKMSTKMWKKILSFKMLFHVMFFYVV